MQISKLVLLMVCAVALFALTGCLGGGGGSSSSDSSSGSSGYAGGSGSTGVSISALGSSASVPVATAHNPEPVTLGLFGGGLIAYALSRRKKK